MIASATPMDMTLKPLHTLRSTDLPHVTTPFYALLQLKSAWLGYCRIQGWETAWESCLNRSGPWDWNYQARAFETLCGQVEQGDWVLVLPPDWPPLMPAYRENQGQWRVSDAVWDAGARRRLESQTLILQRQTQEQAAFASQYLPSSSVAVQTEPAVGPGNRPATLGPPPGLHNQDWSNVNTKQDSFKTVRQVDMGKLSVEDNAAKEILLDQGRNVRDIKQLLSSGDQFTVKTLKPGDKLYGFDSQSNKYGAKKQDSMYWLDEPGYQNVKATYYKNGQWDKEGVKNHLALPCMNRADAIDVATVTQPQQALVSTVGKAREQIAYTRTNYTTGMIGKIMPGGGRQITPDPTKTSAVTRSLGTTP